MKLVKQSYTYEKEGKQRKGYNFYIQLENGSKVAVKAAFKQDYNVLVIVAEGE